MRAVIEDVKNWAVKNIEKTLKVKKKKHTRRDFRGVDEHHRALRTYTKLESPEERRTATNERTTNKKIKRRCRPSELFRYIYYRHHKIIIYYTMFLLCLHLVSSSSRPLLTSNSHNFSFEGIFQFIFMLLKRFRTLSWLTEVTEVNEWALEGEYAK